MSNAKTVLVLVPSGAQQAQADELLSALKAAGQEAQQMSLENADQVLDALQGAVRPVVIK